MKNLLNWLPDWFFRLLKKIGTERRYQVSFGVSTAGLGMIVISHLLDSHAELQLIRTVLLEIGIACIIAAIAEFLLLKHASEVFRQEVQEDIKGLEHVVATFQQDVQQGIEMRERADEILRQEVQGEMKILSHCLEHQLVDIMPPRNQEQEALAVINAAIENVRSGEICINVFTLRDILNSRTSLDGPLRNLLNRDEEVKVKLLLVDPTSDAAHIRVMAEEGSETRFEDSKLHLALQTNFYGIKEIIGNAKNKKFKIEALFYNILPNFYMVSTPDEVFIEPYHLGHKNGEESSIGGIVPLLRFSSKSPMYKFAQLHFSYIWGNPDNGNPPAGDELENRNPPAGDELENRNPPVAGAQHNNGYIRVKTMDEVELEINRRLGRSERRSKTSTVTAERRSALDRREGMKIKVRSAAATQW